jgi:hypothetical protein
MVSRSRRDGKRPASRGATYTKSGKRVTKLSLARSQASGKPITRLRTATGKPIPARDVKYHIAAVNTGKPVAVLRRLGEYNIANLNSLPINDQEKFLNTIQKYPDGIPKDIPDPFEGVSRGVSWRLYYSTRGGIRYRGR